MLKEEGRRKKEEGRRQWCNIKLKPTLDIVVSPKIYRFWE
jgi:hypothetical protein